VKIKYLFPLILLAFIVFSEPGRSELLLEISPEIKSLLAPDVIRRWGETVTVKSSWKSLIRDRKRLAPGYPWILITEEVRGRFSESDYLKNLKVLNELAEGDTVRLRGKYALEVSDEKLEGGQILPRGEGYYRICLLVESLREISPGKPSNRTLSDADRTELRRAIQEEKLKAAREPTRASTSRNKLARLYLKAGEYEKAINEYRFEMILNPDRASSYRRKIAEIYELMGETERARVEYELADLTRPESDSRRYRERLEKWEDEENYGPLIQEYRFLLQTDPDSSSKYLKKIARLFAASGDKENSRLFWRRLIELYREVIEEKPARAFEYHLRIADIYREMEDPEKALAEYGRAGKADPEQSARALIEEADLRRDMGEAKKAWESYLQAEKEVEGEDLVSLRTEMARFLEREESREEAIAYLEKAAGGGGRAGARANLKLARLLEREGRSEEALTSFRKALGELGQDYRSRIWEDMGDILLELGRSEEARQAYRNASDALKTRIGSYAPDEGELRKLAELEEKAGSPEEAFKYYRELLVVLSDLIEEKPDEADRYFREMEEVYRKMEKYDEAAELCRQWIRRQGENPTPYRLLSYLYRDHLDDEKLADAYREKSRALREKQRSQ